LVGPGHSSRDVAHFNISRSAGPSAWPNPSQSSDWAGIDFAAHHALALPYVNVPRLAGAGAQLPGILSMTSELTAWWRIGHPSFFELWKIPAASQSQELGFEASLDTLYRVQFGWIDVLRRVQGNALAAAGFDSRESQYQIIASAPHWRLRDYGGQKSAAVSLFVVAGPIKRPYIWDLSPSRSAICYCLQQDLHAYLLEWMPATQLTSNNGIDESTLAISNCVAKISARSGRSKPFLVGHSLGGTLAAIYGALASETIGGLILLGAPLCFEPKSSQFRDALVSLIPSSLPDAKPFPGSLLSHMSAIASPNTFI
jgi:hypothetical protein